MRVGIATEAGRILVDPGDGAAHLVGHRHEIAAGLGDVDEIERHEMRPCMHEQLSLERIVLRQAAAPGPAVDEDMDRSIRAPGRIKIGSLDRARAIGQALGCAEPRADSSLLVAVALDDLSEIGRVFALVIGVVELFLIEVEPNRGALGRRGAGAVCCAIAAPIGVTTAAVVAAASNVRRLISLLGKWSVPGMATSLVVSSGIESIARSCARLDRALRPQPRLSSLKKSLPLSSITMKAGKFSTSMLQIASMPSSGYSTVSTFLMWCSAKLAAEPPIEAR